MLVGVLWQDAPRSRRRRQSVSVGAKAKSVSAGGRGQVQQVVESPVERTARERQERIAAQSTGGAGSSTSATRSCLRTPQTIQQLQSVQATPGQPFAILQYFSTLLEYGKLNTQESIELVRPVVQQQRRDLIAKWLKEDKLGCTEELGDIVKPLEESYALSIYLRAGAHEKAIGCFAEQGQHDQIEVYVKRVGYQADYSSLEVLHNQL
eukprot:gnl/TRDRNA2_/TRDRNA2_204031_c0_seq1.p1 gnl/TRDRNA2_/TRDRNA2_204031_c0~~gnl/TRDRNA2_/TRDRNA2_204031_c0_seq1.p1  ORF type:complete len:208 (-),score=15.24 gnl/TRDRNA2_/TRDRNA2_204031_c0_seq1:80-703(-)